MTPTIRNHNNIIIPGNKEDLVVKMSSLFPFCINIDFVFVDVMHGGNTLKKSFIYQYMKMMKDNSNLFNNHRMYYPSVAVSLFTNETINKLLTYMDPVTLQEVVQITTKKFFNAIDFSFEDIQEIVKEYSPEFDKLETIEDCDDLIHDIDNSIEGIFMATNSQHEKVIENCKNMYTELAIYLNSFSCQGKIFLDNMSSFFKHIGKENTASKDMRIYKGMFGACYYFENGI